MKKLTNLIIIALLTITIFSCKKKDDEATPDTRLKDANGAIILTGEIKENLTLKSTEKYLLQGFVYVAEGFTLTIEPGTIIKGDLQTKGTLIVRRGAKIMADGTQAKPIVFTSNQAKGARKAGDWGGVVLLGKANVNKSPATIEGEGISQFGGTENADNSGVLRYVRIEFAGIAFATDQEINGLTLGGVGSGTTIDYVQISYSGDDSFEWFGGTVNAKHLIALAGVDDDFDTDNGFSGKVQFGLALRDPNIADQGTGGSSSTFESDNDATGTVATPQTSAVFSNITSFLASGAPNSRYRAGIFIRRNSALSIYNSVLVGHPEGVRIDNEGVPGNVSDNLLNSTPKSYIKGVVIAANTLKPIEVKNGASLTDITNYFNGGNLTVATADLATLKLKANYNSLTAPALLPDAGSPLLTGGMFDAKANDAAFDKTATYRGAFGTTDWTTGWANFDPKNADY